MVDPATLPDILPAPSRESEEGERKIELSEIIGLPDFDVCPYLLLFLLFDYPPHFASLASHSIDLFTRCCGKI
jgi:hypothetical protein